MICTEMAKDKKENKISDLKLMELMKQNSDKHSALKKLLKKLEEDSASDKGQKPE